MAFSASETVAALCQANQNNKLAHAYLITGGQAQDRNDIVLGLSEKLLNQPVSSIEEAAHENLHIIRPEGAIGLLKIDSIREMEKRFHHSAGSQLRIGVLIDAERMNPQAANAFLKTLEEPPANILLLLLSGRSESSFLPTILSRCLRIRLPESRPPGDSDPNSIELRQALAAHFNQPETLSSALTLAGTFTTLLKSEKDKSEKSSQEQYKEEVDKYKNASEGDWLKQRELHHKARVNSSYLIRRNELLRVVQSWLGDALRTACNPDNQHFIYPEDKEATTAIAQQLSQDDLILRLEALSELQRNLQTNASETLAIEVAFLKTFQKQELLVT